MTGIILINFGGPISLNEVTTFLKDIFKDVLPSFLKPFASLLAAIRSPRSKKMYSLIGGSSPVVDLTATQAAAIQKIIGNNYKVYIGMKYGSSSIDEAIDKAKNDGCKKIYLLPLFIYESRYTRVPEGLEVIKIPYNHPLYIKCQTDIIRASLLENTHLIFSIHSVPKRSSISNTYVKQIEESVSEIMKGFPGTSYQIAYQSAPFPIGWTKPSVKDAFKQLRHSGTYALRHCLIIPLGFACENLETIYEIDRLYIPYVKKLGLNVARTPALNNHPLFIDMLAKLVLDSH